MMNRKKKAVPGAPPEPPRDNGLPAKPPELAAARDSLQALLPGVNVATGFGLDPRQQKKPIDSCWLLFVFSDDKDLQVPAEHAGFPVRRMGVPKAGPARPR